MDRAPFGRALDAVSALGNGGRDVRHDLFADLLDSNVPFSPRRPGDRRRHGSEFSTAYRDAYANGPTTARTRKGQWKNWRGLDRERESIGELTREPVYTQTAAYLDLNIGGGV